MNEYLGDLDVGLGKECRKEYYNNTKKYS